jgi:hypothetical protein
LLATTKPTPSFYLHTQNYVTQEGVCRKSIDKGKDFGYCGRQIQYGLHGRRRKGKLEFPGLIARGIVSASGYIQGGRAAGGEGLTPTYTINRDVLLTFIPETDDEPMGEPYHEPLGELMPTSSFSLSLPLNTTDLSAGAREGEGRSEGHVVVDSRPPKNQKRGQENAPVSPEDLDALRDARRARQLEREMTDSEIFRDYKAVFDRLEQEYQARENFERKCYDGGIDYRTNPEYAAMPVGAHFENPFNPKAKHIQDAAELYRTHGSKVVLKSWEDFLVNDTHEITTRVPVTGEDGCTPTGDFTSETVERTWLLYDFVLFCGGSMEPKS